MLRRASLILALSIAPIFTYAQTHAVDLNADRVRFQDYRGLWIDRFDYSVSNAQTQIPQMMQNAKDLGFTDIMFQVRGEANAFYWDTNNLESRASGVTQTNDPLKIAIDAAHARGLRLHAYVNAMPIWRGTATPPANHVYNTHPEFRIRDANGVEAPFNSSYVTANPTRDEFRAHFNAVVNQIATKYDIDGIHLDYIRLTTNTSGSTTPFEYPMDPWTLNKFAQRYPGLPVNKANMQMFVADEISTLVQSLRDTTKAAKPKAQLTASVWRDADIGKADYQQDWARWVDSGWIDAVMPMIYRSGFGDTDAGDLYRLNVEEAMSRRSAAGIMPGLGTYMQADAATAYANVINQLTYARDHGANGVQVFDYSTLVSTNAAQIAAKNALRDFFAANRGVPTITTLADFNVDEGPFKWGPAASGTSQNVAATSTLDQVTTEARTGAGSQRLVINKTAGASSFLLRHLSGTVTGGDAASNVPLASIGSVGLWIKTSTPDLQIAFGVDDDADINSASRTTSERSYFQNVIPDGQWHKYEWSLADATHWDSFNGSNGHLSSIFSTDAIHIIGSASVNELFIDDVFYDAGSVAPPQWTLDANGNYHAPGNWTGAIPNSAGAIASFRRRATGPRTITFDKATTVGALQFDSSAPYTLTGASFGVALNNPAGNASIQVINRGSHTISAQVTLQDNLDVFVDRGSTLTVTRPFAGGATRALTKTGDGSLSIAPDQDLASLSVNTGAVILQNGNKHARVGTLNIAEGAKLDLGDNDLIVAANAINRSALLAHITERIADARNDSGTPWASPGLTSSAAQADVSGLTTLGVILNDRGDGSPVMTSFNGRAVDVNSILVKYTYTGDLNLDGRVTIADYLQMDRGQAQGLAGYAAGDLDYSGVINGADYFLIDQSFLGQGAPMAGEAFAASAVPEPSLLAMIPLAATALLRRRRATIAR